MHNGILVAIAAHGLLGLSLLWDKILLRRPATQNLVSYVFWMGALSIFGVVLTLFGFHMPTPGTAALAFGAGALELAAIFFYYLALQQGEASEALATMGGFSPVATALVGIALLGRAFARGMLPAFLLLVLGGFVMFVTEKMNYHHLLPPILMASGLYGLLNVLQKIAFNRAGFVTGFVFFTLGTFAGSMLLLTRRSWRRQIFEHRDAAEPSSRFWYFVNRFVNGVGSFLVFYAISLANPAVVDAISAVRYVIIFLGAYALTNFKPAWLNEDFSRHVLAGKAVATGLIAAGVSLVGLRGGPAS